jgi:hypothetical protein
MSGSYGPDILMRRDGILSPRNELKRKKEYKITRQRSFSCTCGRTPIVAKGLCASCYAMKRYDEEHFGGLREDVLRRDGHACCVCGKSGWSRKSILVHHRVPGLSVMAFMISLCISCHDRVHKLAMLDDSEASELFRILWREQHPKGQEQYELDFTKKLPCPESKLLFDLPLSTMNFEKTELQCGNQK